MSTLTLPKRPGMRLATLFPPKLLSVVEFGFGCDRFNMQMNIYSELSEKHWYRECSSMLVDIVSLTSMYGRRSRFALLCALLPIAATRLLQDLHLRPNLAVENT